MDVDKSKLNENGVLASRIYFESVRSEHEKNDERRIYFGVHYTGVNYIFTKTYWRVGIKSGPGRPVTLGRRP